MLLCRTNEAIIKDMSVDPETISLTDAQKRALAELSDRIGKSWTEVFFEAIAGYRPTIEAIETEANGDNRESFSAAVSRLGLMGCIEGPADLSVNPAYMKGLGEREN